jgi:hypothetical protein
VGPWVGEMAGEVGDSIWPPTKEEAHQRVVSTGGAARLEGNGGEGWHPVVGVSGSRLGKVVGTRAVIGATSMERVGDRRRLVPVTPSRRKWMAARCRVA